MPQDWDRIYKIAFDYSPSTMMGLCGIEVGDDTITALPTEYVTEVRSDRVYRVGSRIVHIEIQVADDPNLELRLVLYWAGIVQRHKEPPIQVVLLPRGGRYTGHYRHGDLALDYRVVDLAAMDPGTLLDGPMPGLSMLATDKPEAFVGPLLDRMPKARRSNSASLSWPWATTLPLLPFLPTRSGDVT